MTIKPALFAAALLAGCSSAAQSQDVPEPSGERANAYFAMGCFWCGEADFEKKAGIVAVSGYAGGRTDNPTYEAVSAGGTGHYEAVKVNYDTAQWSYEQLLDIFWKNVDPFDAAGQFCDKGESYRPAIFPVGAEQRRLAQISKAAVEKRFGREVAVEIVSAEKFWPAEDYHQDYYEKNPLRYKLYRTGCGRDARLEEVWGE